MSRSLALKAGSTSQNCALIDILPESKTIFLVSVCIVLTVAIFVTKTLVKMYQFYDSSFADNNCRRQQSYNAFPFMDISR